MTAYIDISFVLKDQESGHTIKTNAPSYLNVVANTLKMAIII